MTNSDPSQNNKRHVLPAASTSTSSNKKWGRMAKETSPLNHPAVVTNAKADLSNQKNTSSSNWIQMIRQDSTSNKDVKIKRKSWRNDDFDDDDQFQPIHTNSTTPTKASVPVTWAHLLHLSFRLMMGATVTLYLLNQKHLLPKQLSSVVSRTLFWPTLPITVSRRIGKWVSDVDDTVVMGGAPFGFCHIPDKLYDLYGVRGVVNMCEEYDGPTRKYSKLGMEELHLKTVDHFEPSLEDLQSAVSFIRKHEKQNKRVYVHCRAGHGRSAAVVLAWLLYKNPESDPLTLNQYLCEKRNVRKTLWKQPNINDFYFSLQKKK